MYTYNLHSAESIVKFQPLLFPFAAPGRVLADVTTESGDLSEFNHYGLKAHSG